jgi:hypothetical protein
VLVQRKLEVGEAVKEKGEQTTAKWKREREGERERDCAKPKQTDQSDCQSGSKQRANCSYTMTTTGIRNHIILLALSQGRFLKFAHYLGLVCPRSWKTISVE